MRRSLQMLTDTRASTSCAVQGAGALHAHLDHLSGMLHPAHGGSGSHSANLGSSLSHHYAQHHNLMRSTSQDEAAAQQLPPLQLVRSQNRPASPLPVHPLPHHFLLHEEEDEGEEGLREPDQKQALSRQLSQQQGLHLGNSCLSQHPDDAGVLSAYCGPNISVHAQVMRDAPAQQVSITCHKDTGRIVLLQWPQA